MTKINIKTLQEWIEWAEEDTYNEEQYELEMIIVDDLKKWLYENTLKPNASCQDVRRQSESRIKREAFKIVLEELGGAE